MTDFHKPSFTRTALSFTAVSVVCLGLVGVAVWVFGPTPYSETNPYADTVAQNPTGAGSNPEGTVALSDDGVVMHVDTGSLIDGSGDASDLTAIERPGYENTVADEGRRLLSPSDVHDLENGTVSNDTGLIRADEVEGSSG
ncbi:hypothetical protein [Marivita hallyeonensis]|uniref:Uncharacterized protein n=1 Tax=Marivita hallyeonensis TaxID=996342 RepID=A0A1M5XRC2_9RHOB|nr:hypothetical protein [Marivita hallyeonensis]SHI02340.1 hypothetical protein SAMN05443551_4079 [Marivita hallyeonensis]